MKDEEKTERFLFILSPSSFILFFILSIPVNFFSDASGFFVSLNQVLLTLRDKILIDAVRDG
jgi:type III secretory pathway component EscS